MYLIKKYKKMRGLLGKIEKEKVQYEEKKNLWLE